MDKTTTWLIRGAAIVVIIVGWVSYLDPYLKKQSEIKSNKDYEYESLNAEKRCRDFPEFNDAEFKSLYDRDLIKEATMHGNLPVQFETTYGKKFITDFYPDKDLMDLLAIKNIPIRVGSNLMCK